MSAHFLGELMRFALARTQAERALAYDLDLNIVSTARFSSADVLNPDFKGPEYVQRALDSGHVLVTNNAVNDPARAPITNTNFSDLRIIVVIPVAGVGAIYLDQPIRRGIISKDLLARLAQAAADCASAGSMDFEAYYNA